MPAAAASGVMVLKCWRARISVGAISAACRPPSMTVAAASNATTVLPEPTSPCSRRSMRCGLGEIGDDVGDRARLRRRERVGQRLDQLLAQVPGAGCRAAGRAPQMRAHQGERQLTGEQLVIGEPRPGQPLGRHVGRLGRPVQGAQRLGERWKPLARDPARVLPFRQIGQACRARRRPPGAPG